MNGPCLINILSEQDIVLARQTGRKLAKDMGFNNIHQSRVATAISELARNILLYAGTGTISIDTISRDGKVGIQIIALDNGPGIRDIRKAMEDGYSTSGGLGAGLPGVKRLMDEFMIDSRVEQGTQVIIVKWRV